MTGQIGFILINAAIVAAHNGVMKMGEYKRGLETPSDGITRGNNVIGI